MFSIQKHAISILFSFFLLNTTTTIFGMEPPPRNFGTHPFTPKMVPAFFPLTIFPLFYTMQNGKIIHAEVVECSANISDEMHSIIANAHPPDEITCDDIWTMILEPFLLNATKRSVSRDQRTFNAVQVAFIAWIHGTCLRVELDDTRTSFIEKPLWEKLKETKEFSPDEAQQLVDWLIAKVYNLGLFEISLAPLPSALTRKIERYPHLPGTLE